MQQLRVGEGSELKCSKFMGLLGGGEQYKSTLNFGTERKNGK